MATSSSVSSGRGSLAKSSSVSTGVTLHVWAPKKTNTAQSDIARSITVLGATGVIRLWEFDHASAASNKWKDSRRSSSYGASGNSIP